MSSPWSEVPPPKSLQAMLRKITETLARELADPSECTPDWSDFEWIAALSVATMYWSFAVAIAHIALVRPARVVTVSKGPKSAHCQPPCAPE